MNQSSHLYKYFIIFNKYNPKITEPMNSTLKFLFLFLFVTSIFTACKKEDLTPIKEPEPTEIAEFIWDGLKTYYLWNYNVSNLSLTRGSEAWKKALNAHKGDYESLFNSCLYLTDHRGEAVDQWSWIIDDYEKQEEAFSGITKSFGFEYNLGLTDDDHSIFGYVTYILPNSPASKTDLKRGDIFISVDNIKLDESNYKSLLFTKNAYTLGLADVNDFEINANGKKVCILRQKIMRKIPFFSQKY